MFGSIFCCFAYSLINAKYGDRFITLALFFTLIADFFLVICTEQHRLWGMVFFLGAQTVYAIRLQRKCPHRGFLICRIALIILAEGITLAVLKDKTDMLAVVSLCYYANLIVSIFEGFGQLTVSKLFPLGMLLFLLCDTVIGLQIATGEYLPVVTDSVLSKILYPGFNLAWLFYLPSQVLLALCTLKKVKTEEIS